jgi:hypothetical protein
MSADDFFMGWFFMIFWGPVLGIIHAIIALPTTLFARYVHKRAGFITWVLTITAILAYKIVTSIKAFTSGYYERLDTEYLMIQAIFSFMFFIMPQAAAYPLTRNHPWRRPLAAGGLAIGVAILYMILGFLLGATPD